MRHARSVLVNLPAVATTLALGAGVAAGVSRGDAAPPGVATSVPGGDGVSASVAPAPAGETPSLLQVTDFSGYWARDIDASRVETSEVLAGLGGGGAPERLFVSQARNGTLIISSGHNPSAARAYLIGGETRVTAPGVQGGTMTLTTRRQGDFLVSEGQVTHDDGVVRVREVLSLTGDGDTLIIEATITGAAAEVSNRLVYRRWDPSRQAR